MQIIFLPEQLYFYKNGGKILQRKIIIQNWKKKKEINSFQICKILLKDIEKFWYRYFVKKKKIIRDSIRLRFVEFIEKFLRASKNLRDNAKSCAQSW